MCKGWQIYQFYSIIEFGNFGGICDKKVSYVEKNELCIIRYHTKTAEGTDRFWYALGLKWK